VDRIVAPKLADRLEDTDRPWVLDVRGAGEREKKAILGTVHIPLDELNARIGEIPRDGREIVVHCAGGYRSSTAASLLRAHEIGKVTDLVGGIQAWEALGLPVVSMERLAPAR
jgi:rhodanese-related sulfurtransferase